MRKKSPPIHVVSHGLFTIFGITINFNAVLTAVVTSISWILITYIGHTISKNSAYIRSIPKLQQSVLEIQKEQDRVKREYHPPVKTPTPCPSPSPLPYQG